MGPIWLEIGCLTVPRLIHERPDLYDFSVCQPDIVYLQIGGNDLSNTMTSSESVANEIYSFANFLHFGLHIPVVIIGELLFPNSSNVGKNYNDKVVATNMSILQKIEPDNLPNLIFWRHHGFWEDFLSCVEMGCTLTIMGWGNTSAAYEALSFMPSQFLVISVLFKIIYYYLHNNRIVYFNWHAQSIQQW